MTILFAGNELDAFTLSGTAFVMSTRAGFFDPVFTRASIEVKETSNITGTFSANSTDGWFQCNLAMDVFATDQDARFLEIRDSTANQVVLQLDFDNGDINLEYWNGVGFTEIAPSFRLSLDLVTTVALHWILSSAGGVFEWYMNEELIGSFTGDTLSSNNSYNVINQFRIHSPRNAVDSGRHVFVSEMLVSDMRPVGYHVATIVPESTGNSSDWAGSFTDIDAIGLDDTTFIESTVAAEIELNVCSNLSTTLPSQVVDVVAVTISARVNQPSTVGPDKVEAALRTSGSNFFSSAYVEQISASTTHDGGMRVFNLNPIGSSKWTISDINSLEIGVRSVT